MMKKFYKYSFIVLFIVLPFLFINNVQADYKAKVLNPKGASCHLRNGSTGYCYYKDSNLNSYVGNVVWLDTGDEVTVLTDHKTIPTNNADICKDYYVYTSFYFAKYATTYNGYYCNANLDTGEVSDEMKEEFKRAGFPESYWKDLALLKKAHPDWNFVAINTNLDFSEAVTNQTYGNKSLLRGSMSKNYAYLSSATDSFDYINDRFIPYDANNDSDPWYKANYDAIAYYMDPRNFLNNTDIFQFKTLALNNDISDENFKKSINSMLGNDYLAKFTDYFVEAGRLSLVDPIYLASLSKQEVANGSTAGTAINGKYNGMYNFYNIGATSGDDPVYRGLNFAANTDESTMRPWSDEYRAIVGGAKWIYTNYVYPGQVTSYFKKFNVVHDYLISIGVPPTYANYDHQYMQNIKAPSSESYSTYISYNNIGLLDISYTFYIPVYKNMPDNTVLPTKEGWPNNYLSNIVINGKNIPEFNSEVEIYEYSLDINTPKITIEANTISGSAKVKGTGTFTITKDTTKTITVTAQNGNVKKYKVKIKLTGTKLEDPVDVVTTLNNAGIKNGNKYLSGFAEKSDISVIKNKILNANKDAKVELKNSSGKVKDKGNVATGDKVTITVGTDTKTYEIILYGDVNGDGKIMASDYKLIKDSIMGTITLSGPYKEAADVDRNGKPAAADYKRIKDSIMGIGTIVQ